MTMKKDQRARYVIEDLREKSAMERLRHLSGGYVTTMEIYIIDDQGNIKSGWTAQIRSVTVSIPGQPWLFNSKKAAKEFGRMYKKMIERRLRNYEYEIQIQKKRREYDGDQSG